MRSIERVIGERTIASIHIAFDTNTRNSRIMHEKIARRRDAEVKASSHRSGFSSPAREMVAEQRSPLALLSAALKDSPVLQARRATEAALMDGHTTHAPRSAAELEKREDEPIALPSPKTVAPVQLVKILRHWKRPSRWRRIRNGGYITPRKPANRRNVEVGDFTTLNTLLRKKYRFHPQQSKKISSILFSHRHSVFPDIMSLRKAIKDNLEEKDSVQMPGGYTPTKSVDTVHIDSDDEDQPLSSEAPVSDLRAHNKQFNKNKNENSVAMSITALYRSTHAPKKYFSDTVRVKRKWWSGKWQSKLRTDVSKTNQDFYDKLEKIELIGSNAGENDSEIAAASDPQIQALIEQAGAELRDKMLKRTANNGFVVLSFLLNVDSYPRIMCLRACRFAMDDLFNRFQVMAPGFIPSGSRRSGRFSAVIRVTSAEKFGNSKKLAPLYDKGLSDKPVRIHGPRKIEVAPRDYNTNGNDVLSEDDEERQIRTAPKLNTHLKFEDD